VVEAVADVPSFACIVSPASPTGPSILAVKQAARETSSPEARICGRPWDA
jgi:hypothetical protein